MAIGYPVYKCDKLSMKVVAEYPSAAAAARDNGLSPTGVAHAAKNKEITYGPYIYRYVEDYDPNETFEGRNNRPIICYDTKTKMAVVFVGTDKAAAALGVDVKRISCSMHAKTRLLGRYVFKFAR